jgi:SAM-dependent methyltransferase
MIVPQGLVLDLACGGGRHTRYLAARGLRVRAVDRDAPALAGLGAIAGVTAQQADLENGHWPTGELKFDGVVVTNYLHRPLFAHILRALSPGGVLIYETFAAGNERHGKPSNPDFLLGPGELLDVVRGTLRVVAYEDIQVAAPRPACIQRICATSMSRAV